MAEVKSQDQRGDRTDSDNSFLLEEAYRVYAQTEE